MMSTTLYRVAELGDIPPQGSCLILSEEVTIALFKTHDNRVYAVEDKCPHKGGPLSEGIVHGDCVTCPLHNMVVMLNTGEAAPPDKGKVRTFAVQVIEGDVFIHLPCVPRGFELPALHLPE